MHRTTGTKVQAQEHRHGRTGRGGTQVQAHRGTGAQGQACARGLNTGPQGFCSHGVRWDAVRDCGSLRYVLGSSLSISHALMNRAENMCLSEYVASYDNACRLRNVCLFFVQEARGCPHSKPRAKKKNNMPRSALVHRAHACEFCSRT